MNIRSEKMLRRSLVLAACSGYGVARPALADSTSASQSESSGDVLIKFTYYGDTNLDSSDYLSMDNFSAPLTGWYSGDFNYDGVIGGQDYTLLDNAYTPQDALEAPYVKEPWLSLPANTANPAADITDQLAGTAAVPEPAVAGLFGAVSGMTLLRRRRIPVARHSQP